MSAYLFGHLEPDGDAGAHEDLGGAVLRDADQRVAVDGEQLVAGLQPSVDVSRAALHHRLPRTKSTKSNLNKSFFPVIFFSSTK